MNVWLVLYDHADKSMISTIPSRPKLFDPGHGTINYSVANAAKATLGQYFGFCEYIDLAGNSDSQF